MKRLIINKMKLNVEGACFSAEGTNNYILTSHYPIEDLINGMTIFFKSPSTNTGNCTIKINNFEVKPLVNENGSEISSGVITEGRIIQCTYDNGKFLLSSAMNAYTKEEIDDKVSTINSTISANKSDIEQKLNTAKSELNSTIEQKVADLVNSAPESLDTLKELSDALGNDPNFSTTVLNKIGQKLDKGTYSGNAQDLKNSIDNLNNNKADKTIKVLAGTGLQGGGPMSGNIPLNIVSADTSLVVGEDNIKVNTLDSVTSTDKVRPASANAVKTAYDNAQKRLRQWVLPIQRTNYRKSVVGLVKLTAYQQASGERFIGKIMSMRNNGLLRPTIVDLMIIDPYYGDYKTGYFKQGTRANNIRPCTFRYNGVLYGGFEYYPDSAAFETVVLSGFLVNSNYEEPYVAIDYYDTENNIALNQEITDSIDFGSMVNLKGDFISCGEIYANDDKRVYHTGFKPTANDVGALPISGGMITGNLGVIGALGAFSPGIDLAIGDSDTGFHSETDGVLQLRANGVIVADTRNNNLNIKRKLDVTGGFAESITKIGWTSLPYINKDTNESMAMPAGAMNFGQLKGNPLGVTPMYYHVFARRDVGGGYCGLAVSYTNSYETYIVTQPEMNKNPVWIKVWTETSLNPNNYISNIRLGTAIYRQVWTSRVSANEDPGYVTTSVRNNNADDHVDDERRRPLQFYKNGTWYTASVV